MNTRFSISIPTTGLANVLANVVGQQVQHPFERFHYKVTVPAAAAGEITLTTRASGRVLKEQSVVPTEVAAGRGPSQEIDRFVDEVVQQGEQLFVSAASTSAGAVILTIEAVSDLFTG